MDAIILINRSGGTAKGDDEIGPKVEAALRGAGISGAVELLDGAGVARRAKEAAAAGAPLVIVGGGDGSQSAAAGAFAGTHTVLGVLPLGTLNHLARDLGIAFDLDQAAQVIASGRVEAIDVADLNGELFVNNSALGLYPLMVVDRDAQQQRLGRSKKSAMVVAALRTLIRFRHARITLCADGERMAIETPLLFVGNNDYAVALPTPGQRKSLTDGKLCVLVLRKKGRWGLFAVALRTLFDRARDDDMIRLDAVEQLRVESHRSHLTVSLDGETKTVAGPLCYAIRKAALRVMVPRSPAPASSTG